MKKDTTYVKWDKIYNVNIKQIDDQHKHFVGIMNKLFVAIQTDEDHAVSKIIDELVSYAKAHFAVEEAYFEKFNYPGAEEHIAEHQKIKAKIDTFLNNKEIDQFKLGYSLLDLLEEWLFHHIVAMDRKYIKFFKANGIH